MLSSEEGEGKYVRQSSEPYLQIDNDIEILLSMKRNLNEKGK